jgi:hypothetical protein
MLTVTAALMARGMVAISESTSGMDLSTTSSRSSGSEGGGELELQQRKHQTVLVCMCISKRKVDCVHRKAAAQRESGQRMVSTGSCKQASRGSQSGWCQLVDASQSTSGRGLSTTSSLSSGSYGGGELDLQRMTRKP